MINQNIIRKRLESVTLENIAEQAKFSLRNDGKIKPLHFVLSFFLSIQGTSHTITSWASQLSILIRNTISYNAMKYAQNENRVNFANKLLQKVISQQLDDKAIPKIKTRLLEKFNHVFLEDSTCFKLPIYLYRLFPGSKNKYGKTAIAKIQLRYELKSRSYHSFTLQRYKDNDQKFSTNIVQKLLPDDLVIRDLGYHVLSVFQQIIDAKAFFISRLRFGVNIYHPQTEKKIDLRKELKKAQRRGVTVLEFQALVGKKTKVNSRIIAIKTPAHVTRKRRKIARTNRRGTNRSKAYFEFLGWTLFITNVEKTTLSAKEIFQVYGYRWRIEIIFKCWKSHFQMEQLFKTQAKLNMHQIKIAVYLFLVWLTLFFVKMYNFFLFKIYTLKQKVLSLLKFAKFIKEHFLALIDNPDDKYWLEHLAYYCTYKKRNQQPNYMQQVFIVI